MSYTTYTTLSYQQQVDTINQINDDISNLSASVSTTISGSIASITAALASITASIAAGAGVDLAGVTASLASITASLVTINSQLVSDAANITALQNFDINLTGSLTNYSGNYIQFSYGSPTTIDNVYFETDTTSWYSYVQRFSIFGSNNGTTWSPINGLVNQLYTGVVDSTFTPVSYQYYRLQIHKLTASNPNYMQVFWRLKNSGVTQYPTVSFSPSAGNFTGDWWNAYSYGSFNVDSYNFLGTDAYGRSYGPVISDGSYIGFYNVITISSGSVGRLEVIESNITALQTSVASLSLANVTASLSSITGTLIPNITASISNITSNLLGASSVANVSGLWVGLNNPSQTVITSYWAMQLTTAVLPTAWTLVGSNDNSTWTIIDERDYPSTWGPLGSYTTYTPNGEGASSGWLYLRLIFRNFGPNTGWVNIGLRLLDSGSNFISTSRSGASSGWSGGGQLDTSFNADGNNYYTPYPNNYNAANQGYTGGVNTTTGSVVPGWIPNITSSLSSITGTLPNITASLLSITGTLIPNITASLSSITGSLNPLFTSQTTNNVSGAWWQYSLSGSATRLYYYGFYADAYNIYDWSVIGSNENTTWYEVDTVNNSTWQSNGSGTYQYVNSSAGNLYVRAPTGAYATTAFKYYRLIIRRTDADSSGYLTPTRVWLLNSAANDSIGAGTTTLSSEWGSGQFSFNNSTTSNNYFLPYNFPYNYTYTGSITTSVIFSIIYGTIPNITSSLSNITATLIPNISGVAYGVSARMVTNFGTNDTTFPSANGKDYVLYCSNGVISWREVSITGTLFINL